jgi:hypothetical protein
MRPSGCRRQHRTVETVVHILGDLAMVPVCLTSAYGAFESAGMSTFSVAVRCKADSKKVDSQQLTLVGGVALAR